MEILFAGIILVVVLAAISVTGHFERSVMRRSGQRPQPSHYWNSSARGILQTPEPGWPSATIRGLAMKQQAA